MGRIITINSNKVQKSLETRDILHKKLIEVGFDVDYEYNPKAELIISIGGDGCFLQTIRDYNIPSIPLAGINTGHLGFFPDITPKDIDAFIQSYLEEDYVTQELPLLETKVATNHGCFNIFGINEAVVKGDKSRTIHLKLDINNKRVQNFSGDGLIISTSAGSTAYNYAVGGSIVDTSLNVIQVAPISPINTNAYRCFSSSIICSHDSVVNVSPECEFENSTLVVVDGLEYNFNEIDNISLSISDRKIKLLRTSNYEFWSRVCEKFL
ncbi:NAD(+)/NADH kinase [Terrisporobacter petrolearius]|uniref:NAD(+)/NADH kinase n=1 Tax=Terrisporobacter petrolearius TaxID=1460447 RepID=UPI003AFFD391